MISGSEFTDESKRFIDKKIDNFIDLVIQSEGKSRSKRSPAFENVFEGNVVGEILGI